MDAIIMYFGIGIVSLCLTMIVNKIAKLKILWDPDSWHNDNGLLELGVIFLWPVFIITVLVIQMGKIFNIIHKR
jgi:hypothetical protein